MIARYIIVHVHQLNIEIRKYYVFRKSIFYIGPRREKYCLRDLRRGPEVIKPFSCSTQLSKKFILLINVKMPTIFGISTFISKVNTTTERLKQETFFICRYFSLYEQLKFCAQLS